MAEQQRIGIAGLESFELIGRGGFAAVYRAYQPKFDRHVAVKVLTVGVLDETGRRRFEREQRAMGSLSAHPAIVTLHDSGFTDEGAPYLVMEFMSGGSLQDRVRTAGRVPWPEAVEIIGHIADAVAVAHRTGMIHRDIKPDNILVSSFGEAKLADFGIATLIEGSMTATSSVAATIEYAPPEVLEGEEPDESADIYALAATLFTMVAGRSAFRGEGRDTAVGVMARVLSAPVPDLRGEGIPDSVCSLIEAGMAKDKRDRPATAAEFSAMLAAAAEGIPQGKAEAGATRVIATRSTLGVPPIDAGATRRLARGEAAAGIRRRRWIWAAAIGVPLVSAAVAVGLVALLGGSDGAEITLASETTSPPTSLSTTSTSGAAAGSSSSTSTTSSTTEATTTTTTVDTTTPASQAGILVPSRDQPGFLFTSVVFANRQGRNYVCGGADPLGMQCEFIDEDEAASVAVALADLNNDGYPDAVFGNVWEADVGEPPPNRVCLNDREGGWDCSDVDADILFDTIAVAAADLDLDGNIDILFGNDPSAARTGNRSLIPERTRVCFGDGIGGFACSNVSERSEETEAGPSTQFIEVADVNRDGNPDLLLAVANYPNEVCLGDGSGAFECSDIEGEAAPTSGAAAADFDRDGNLDVYFTNAGTADRICLGDGAGGFGCGDAADRTDLNLSVAAAFVDRDSNPDVIVGTNPEDEGLVFNQVCLGDGEGGFECADISAPVRATEVVVIRDFDGDGDADVLFAGGPDYICLGDWAGDFTCTEVSPQGAGGRGLVMSGADAVAPLAPGMDG